MQVTPVILPCGTLRQEDCLEFKADLRQSEPLSQHPCSTPYKTLFGVRPRPKGASHCEKIGDLGAHSGSPEIGRHQCVCWTQRRLVWLENRVRGRISEGLWPEWKCQMYVCQVNVCQVKLKLLAVKGAVSSPSYLSSEALEFGKLAATSASCTDWVWPPGGAAILGKPYGILWDHRGQRAETCIGKLSRPGFPWESLQAPKRVPGPSLPT